MPLNLTSGLSETGHPLPGPSPRSLKRYDMGEKSLPMITMTSPSKE